MAFALASSLVLTFSAPVTSDASSDVTDSPASLTKLPDAYSSYRYARCAAYFEAASEWAGGQLYMMSGFDEVHALKVNFLFLSKAAWIIGSGVDGFLSGRFADDDVLYNVYTTFQDFYSERLDENFMHQGNPIDPFLARDAAFCRRLADLPK